MNRPPQQRLLLCRGTTQILEVTTRRHWPVPVIPGSVNRLQAVIETNFCLLCVDCRDVYLKCQTPKVVGVTLDQVLAGRRLVRIRDARSSRTKNDRRECGLPEYVVFPGKAHAKRDSLSLLQIRPPAR
jgi:hypothetical protein